MFIESHTSLLSAGNSEEFLQALLKQAAELDFGWLNAFLVIDHVGQPTEFSHVAAYPPGYESIAGNLDLARIDPVMQHLKTSHRPIAWNGQTYRRQGQEAIWETISPFGYKTGISAVLHLPRGEHFAFGVARAEPLPKDQTKLAHLIGQIQLLTACACEVGMRVLRPQCESVVSTQLNQRERDCLLWTMEGKTAWEIGRIVCLSERTVAGLLGSATRKLECVNKQQAVVKALRLGLLDLH
jgi:DNA-binding CsgD family transcriptional regulator